MWNDVPHAFLQRARTPQFVIMLDWIMDFRNFTTHAVELRRAGTILDQRASLQRAVTWLAVYGFVTERNGLTENLTTIVNPKLTITLTETSTLTES